VGENAEFEESRYGVRGNYGRDQCLGLNIFGATFGCVGGSLECSVATVGGGDGNRATAE
jgi:hypothetical protein